MATIWVEHNQADGDVTPHDVMDIVQLVLDERGNMVPTKVRVAWQPNRRSLIPLPTLRLPCMR
jgi:hypothetical protein